jgi:hypothetical protein
MSHHRNPQASVSKQAPSDNFNPCDAWKGRHVHPVADEPCGGSGGASDAAVHTSTFTEEEVWFPRPRRPRRLDALVHEAIELLGDPHLMVASAAPVPSARSTYALDVAPNTGPDYVARFGRPETSILLALGACIATGGAR